MIQGNMLTDFKSFPMSHLLSSLLAQLDMGMLCLNSEGQIVALNQAVNNLLSPSSTDFKQWIPSQNKQPLETLWHLFDKPGETMCFHTYLLNGAQTPVPVFIQAATIPSEISPPLLMALVQKEDAQTLINATLETREQQIAQALEQGDIIFWEIDYSSREIIFISNTHFEHAKSVISLTSGGLQTQSYPLEKTIADIHPEDRILFLKEMGARESSAPDRFSLEYRYIMPNKSVIWYLSHGRVKTVSKKGKPQRLSGISLNISSQKQAQEQFSELQTLSKTQTKQLKQIEDELQRKQALFEALVENSQHIVSLINAQEEIIYISPSIKEVLGYYPEDVTTGIDLFRSLHQPVSDEPSVLKQALQTPNQTPFSFETRIQRKDGTLAWLKHTCKNMLDAPQIQALIVNSVDISEIKAAEEHLKKSLTQAEEYSELKSRFIATLSHELRTPLANILSSAQILDRGWDRLPEDLRKENITDIQTAVRQVTQLMDNLFFLDRSERNRQTVFWSEIDLVELTQNLVREIHLNLAPKRSVELIISEDSGSIYPTDGQLYKSIVKNLLTNALIYSPETSPITLYLDIQPHQLQLRVQDQGFGISTEDQAWIYDAFFRGSNIRHIEGVGLGLTIVKQALRLLNGRIGFSSERNQGTEFVVTLPPKSPKEEESL